MTDATRARWYRRPVPLLLLTLLVVGAAMIAVIGDYAWRRSAAIAWIKSTGGTIVFGSPWIESLPEWAWPVESVELTRRAGSDIHRLGVLREVKILNLSRAAVSDAQLQHLSGLYQVMFLSINSPGVTDAGLVPLFRYKSLSYLDLGGTEIGDRGVKHLAGHPLQRLNLSHTRVTDGGMDTIAGLTLLHELRLDGTSVGDLGVAKLKGLPLRTLGLAETGVTDAGLAALGAMPDLVKLHLDRTKVGDATLAVAGACTALSTLTVAHTRITDAGLARLTSGTLRTLDLSWTAVSDAGLDNLPPKPELQHLELSGTRVTVPVAQAYANVHSLKLTANARRQQLVISPMTQGIGMGIF